MASKDLKPKTRLGKSHPGRVKFFTWLIGLGACAGGVFATYRYTGSTEVEVPVARVRKGPCGPDQIVNLSPFTSAMEQEGPIMPCIWNGQR